jgi:methylated-DNA-[protein]-cysteine S-methyltransferase
MVDQTVYRSKIESPIGPLVLVSTEKGLAAVGFGKGARQKVDTWIGRVFRGVSIQPAETSHHVYGRQLEEYFAGRRRIFHLKLDLRGTEFQKAVWSEVARIPLGRTATYGEIAHLLGRPLASRAVGAANGANPIPIIIPCHRVIGAGGALTGYGGGLSRKRWLLAHEGVLKADSSVQMGLFRA